MVIDADIEQFPDRFGPLDDLARKIPGKRNITMTLDRGQQRAYKSLARRIPSIFFPRGDGATIINELAQNHENATSDDKVASRIVLDNTIVIGDFVFPTASHHYRTFWIRDAHLMEEYTESAPFKRKLVEELGYWQRKTNNESDGQIPTEICLSFLPPFRPLRAYRPDESTLTWLIMALESGYQNWEQIVRAKRYVDRHVSNGRYLSPAGNRRSNIDALDFPGDENGETVIGYVNLLHAHEKNLAAEAGLSDKYDGEEAAESCRQMAEVTEGRYFPLSDTLPWIDPGSTFLGEYLATIHGQPILGKDIVRRTLEKAQEFRMEERGLGLVTEANQQVPAELFIRGDAYQAMRIWPLWDHIFKSVCELNGLNDGSYRGSMLERLHQTNWAEHADAGPEKQWQAWNVFILKMQRDVDKYKYGRI